MSDSKYKTIAPGRRDIYEELKSQGKSKRVAAAIANAGKSKAGRSRMARKAAATRKARGRGGR